MSITDTALLNKLLEQVGLDITPYSYRWKMLELGLRWEKCFLDGDSSLFFCSSRKMPVSPLMRLIIISSSSSMSIIIITTTIMCINC
jgi:hypothetical protein